MITAEFNFKTMITNILCSENDKMADVCQKFIMKAGTIINDVVFLYGGNKINLALPVSSIISKFDRERKIISIIVNDLSESSQNKQNIIKSTIPICPTCAENIKFDINNYRINLTECKKGHSFNLPINEYEQTQNIDLDKIICNKCNAKKLNTYANKMYICNKCKIILCPLCESKHDKSHSSINYDFRNSTCEEHNELYISYCKSCKKNICVKCQKNHLQHDVVQFGEIFPDKDELLNALKEFRKIIDVFNNDINSIIDRFNKVKDNIEMIYKIYYEMVTKYEDKNRNYEAFMSLNGIKNINFVKNLDNINQVNNINDKSKYILSIYEQMFPQNQQNIIDINNNAPKIKPLNPISKKNSSNAQTITNIKDDYNTNSQIKVNDIKQYFSYPPLIGLENLGNSSYMNTTLQFFCNIDKFVNYFKYNSHFIELVKNDINFGNKKLCSSFKLLIDNLWPDKIATSNKKNQPYTPMEFKNKLSLFNYASSPDPKDLIKFIISTLHEETNMAQKNLDYKIKSQDKTNKQLMFNLYVQDFINKNKSVISDLFYSSKYNIIQCLDCKCHSYDYQTYFFLDFPLEEIKIFKNQNMMLNNNFNFNDGGINIYDCFLYEQRVYYLAGQNQLFCNYCRQEANHSKQSILCFGPEILIILLNRGNEKQSNVKIDFYGDLNLNSFIEIKDTGVNYELIGVISYLDEINKNKHFISFYKNPITNCWYKYDDSCVNEIINFKFEVLDYAIPYILFYKKMK